MKKKHAFTLIELLVVISIIAILVAMLAPTLASVMEKGRARDCLNNLRTLGLGITSFQADSKDTMFAKDATGEEVWPKLLHRNYVKDWKSFRSVFDKVTPSRRNTQDEPVPISYGLNSQIFDTFAGKWNTPISSLIMAAPAIDTSSAETVAFKSDAFSTNNVMLLNAGTGGNYGTHSKRSLINVLYADGHVAEQEYTKYSDIATERGKAQWDPFYEKADQQQQ